MKNSSQLQELKKSALQLTSDFFREAFKFVNEWLDQHGIARPKDLLIAEPLALQENIASSEWLTKYRANIKRILSGQYYGFESISFLPEPFAVFQYYRYGEKIPTLAQQAKQNALVIDFGGGTFDVCIIQTTKEGDIKIRGKGSKPLAASSVPIGGYFINRMLAEHLIFKYSKSSGSNKKIRTALKTYWDWRKDIIDRSTLSEEFSYFILNFHRLIYEVENAKISLSKNIYKWDLDNCPDELVPVSVPSKPFSDDCKNISGTLNAKEFQNIYINRVWNQYLKANLQRTLKRGKEELKSDKLTIILLSGGSANIGWLRKLVERDFHEELEGIKIFRLANFEEVVSKGLAIECARRFFSSDNQGDFSNVTYNRICLVMNPDDYGYNVRTFKPKTPELPILKDKPGVLLPSASILKKYFDRPMRWRIKLPRRPSNKLEYKFLRSSLDLNDDENVFNIVDNVVYTPPGIKFDQSIQVELLVKENGTAFPKFIYKTGPHDKILESVQGRPFPIDLTYSQEGVSKAYLGLDFGSSNSSLSIVNENSIQTYIKRSTEKNWIELGELVDSLPFPLACHLASYLKQTDPDRLVNEARDFIELALALLSYISYLEYCNLNIHGCTKILKNYTQRSVGPLWHFSKEMIKKHSQTPKFCSGLPELIDASNFEIIDKAVNEITQHKHGKAEAKKINTIVSVQVIANICQKVFNKLKFGYFENVQKQKFSKEYTGLFRISHGRMPFFRALKYKGLTSFSDDEAIILNTETEDIMSLQPLIFWDNCEKHADISEGHCYFFDKYIEKSESCQYKAAGFSCTCNAAKDTQYCSLADQISEIQIEDKKMDLLSTGNFTAIEIG